MKSGISWWGPVASVACALLAQSSDAIAGPHDALVAKHAAAHGVPESLVRRVIHIESKGNARIVSKGNYGLMQIRLGTAKGMGYRGTAEMALAIERGEIDGICGWDWSSFKSQKPDWLRDGKANVLVQVSVDPHPELTKMGVPTVFEFVKDQEARKVVELVISQTVFHRSYIAPPETPPAQLEMLRKAFDKTMADKEFLADAERTRVDIEPLSGAKVQDVVAKLYAAPPAIVERARKAIRPD